jgi:alpha/beta superfamily hydrolase
MRVTEASVIIPGPAGGIEVVTMLPRPQHDADGSAPGGLSARGLAVICHPHPLMGGTLHNKVVHTLARTHRDLGDIAVRFNFRGTGHSGGCHDQGNGECDDLLATARWANERYPGLPLYLAGFSFGSWVCARSVQRLVEDGMSLQHLLLVAPPVHHFGFETLTTFPVPVTIIMGEEDEVVPPEDVYAWVERITTPCKLLRMPGAGHFFHGRLNDLKALVESSVG